MCKRLALAHEKSIFYYLMVYEGKEVTREDDTHYGYGNYAKMVM